VVQEVGRSGLRISEMEARLFRGSSRKKKTTRKLTGVGGQVGTEGAEEGVPERDNVIIRDRVGGRESSRKNEGDEKDWG